jgi:hypothetical protein
MAAHAEIANVVEEDHAAVARRVMRLAQHCPNDRV